MGATTNNESTFTTTEPPTQNGRQPKPRGRRRGLNAFPWYQAASRDDLQAEWLINTPQRLLFVLYIGVEIQTNITRHIVAGRFW